MSDQIRVADGAAQREEALITPEKVLAGDAPKGWTENAYISEDGKFFSGLWGSTPGKWTIAYTEEETCHLLEGVVIVADEAGRGETYRAGDSFIIPKGFKGTWETVETCKKLYAIYEP